MITIQPHLSYSLENYATDPPLLASEPPGGNIPYIYYPSDFLIYDYIQCLLDERYSVTEKAVQQYYLRLYGINISDIELSDAVVKYSDEIYMYHMYAYKHKVLLLVNYIKECFIQHYYRSCDYESVQGCNGRSIISKVLSIPPTIHPSAFVDSLLADINIQTAITSDNQNFNSRNYKIGTTAVNIADVVLDKSIISYLGQLAGAVDSLVITKTVNDSNFKNTLHICRVLVKLCLNKYERTSEERIEFLKSSTVATYIEQLNSLREYFNISSGLDCDHLYSDGDISVSRIIGTVDVLKPLNYICKLCKESDNNNAYNFAITTAAMEAIVLRDKVCRKKMNSDTECNKGC